MKLINEWITFLSQPDLTAAEVISHIGSTEGDPGTPLPIKLKPGIKEIMDASLFLDAESGLPYILDLRLAPETNLHLNELKKAFPVYKRAINSPGSPRQFLFYPDDQHQECIVVLIVELSSEDFKIDNPQLHNLTFRRDLDIDQDK